MFDLSLRRGLAASATALLICAAPALAQQQPAQEPPATDQPAQDQPAQDQPGQDQAAQDQQAQDQQQPQVQEVPEGLAAALYLSVDDVRAVQQALQEAGHDPGSTDGLWGSQSRQAMRDYQREHGLPASGNIDLGTLRTLQLLDPVLGQTGAPAMGGPGPDTGMPGGPMTPADPAAPADPAMPGDPAPGAPGAPAGRPAPGTTPPAGGPGSSDPAPQDAPDAPQDGTEEQQDGTEPAPPAN
jgi:peptidoglycan hydrolase-like protein with peptidoglycan-binding domain